MLIYMIRIFENRISILSLDLSVCRKRKVNMNLIEVCDNFTDMMSIRVALKN